MYLIITDYNPLKTIYNHYIFFIDLINCRKIVRILMYSRGVYKICIFFEVISISCFVQSLRIAFH